MNPIKYSDLISPEGNDTIQQAISELTQLIEVYNDAKKIIVENAKEQVAALKSVSGAREEQRNTIVSVNEQTERLEQDLQNVSEMEKKALKTRNQLTQAEKDAIQLKKLERDLNNAARGSYNALSAQYRKNMIELRAMGEQSKQNSNRFRELTNETRRLREQMSAFHKNVGDYRMEVGHYQNAIQGLGGPLGNIISKFNTLDKSFEEISKSKMPALRKGFAYIGNSIAAVVAGVVALGKGLKDVITINKDFEQTSAVLASVLGKDIRGIKVLTDTALSLGRTTEWTASQVLELQTSLAKMGYGEGSIINMQKHILGFATAVGADLDEAATMAATTLRAFNLTSRETEDALGVLAVGVNSSALTFERLKYSMGTVFPVAKAFGLNVKDTVALLGALANAGFSAESAATGARNVLIKLADEEGKIAKRTGSAAKTFDEIIEKLKLLKAEGTNLSDIFGLTEQRAAAPFAALLENVDRLRELQEALADVQGELERIRTTRLDTVQGQTIILTSKWQDLKLALQQSNGVLKDIVVYFQKLVDSWKVFYFPQQAIQASVLDKSLETLQQIYAEGGKEAVDAYIQSQNAEFEKQMGALGEKADDRILKRAGIFGKLIAGKSAISPIVNKIFKGNIATVTEMQALQSSQEAFREASLIINQQILEDEAEKIRQDAQADADKKEFRRQSSEEERKQRIKDLRARIEQIKMEISYTEEGTQQMLNKRLELVEAQRDLEIEVNWQAEESARKDWLVIQKKYDHEREVTEENHQKTIAQIRLNNLQKEKDALDTQLAYMEENSEDWYFVRSEIINKQRDIELEQNRQKDEKMRLDEASINAKYDYLAQKEWINWLTWKANKNVEYLQKQFNDQQSLAASEFALLNTTEREKTEFRLQQEIERLEMTLELDKEAAEKMSEIEKQTIRNQIAYYKQQIEDLPYQNLYEFLGINITNEQQKALTDAWAGIRDGIQLVIDSYREAADAAVESADRQVESAQRVLELEMQARANGYANSVETSRKELELARSSRKDALEEQAKAQKAQLRLDSIEQASSLTTASANIWKAFSGLGAWGIGLASTSIAAMWISFLAAQAKARSLADKRTEYGEGTVELLQGGSHASGKDIDMGYDKRRRRHRRAEGGEYFAIINKRQSSRHRTLIPDVINSLNDGTFTQKYQRANDALGGVIYAGADITNLEKDVHAMRKQGEETRIVDNQGRIIVKYKNLITIKK